MTDRFAAVRAEALRNMDAAGQRRLTCGRCGTAFGCSPVGKCWCSDEDFRLPVPLPDSHAQYGDCLCPDCLRLTARELAPLRPAAI